MTNGGSLGAKCNDTRTKREGGRPRPVAPLLRVCLSDAVEEEGTKRLPKREIQIQSGPPLNAGGAAADSSVVSKWVGNQPLPTPVCLSQLPVAHSR